MPLSFHGSRRFLLALLALTSSGLLAQTAPTSPPLPAKSDNADAGTILLSPFEVRTDGDYGYTATSALAGGRTDTPLKLTSAAISVMTSQFLEDIGSTNFRSAGEWALNWVPQLDVNQAVAGGFSINYRNMGNTFASRNYFLWYVESDSYNTERYEFARGPNAVIFGDGGPGGISTTWTKRPRFDRSTYAFNARADSFGGWRSSVDVNRAIAKNFALRLNAFAEDAPSFRDNNINERQGIHLAGNYRLTQRNQFRFEGEFGLQRRTLFPSSYSDQGSFWNRTANYNGVTAPSTNGTGVARISTNPFFVYIPGTANNGLNDWGPFYQSTGTGLGILQTGETRKDIPNAPSVPNKEFNFQPPDSIAKLRYWTYSLYFDHRFSDNLFVEVGFNRVRNDRHSHGSQSLFSTYRVDVNTVLPGGATNPNYGKAFTDAERVRSLQGNIVSDFRALLNWRFDTRWGMKQSFSVIAGSRLDRFDSYSRTLRRVNGTNPNLTNAANQFRERRYWDQGAIELGGIPQMPGVDLDYIPTAISHQRKNLDYGQIASSSRFFNDRLAVTLGARRDSVTNVQQTTTGVPVDPVTGLPRLGAVVIDSNNVPVAIIGGKTKGTFDPVSRNAGAVFFLTSWLGVYGNYSETFAAPNSGNNLIDGTTPPISQSKGKDFGFKLELLNGKISGTVSYYTSEQEGLLITGGNTTEINRIWTNLGRADLATVAFRDTQDQKGDGYELDITANPTRNLRFTANLALPETAAVNLQPGLTGYFADNLAAWQAGAAGSLNPTQVNNDINTIRNALNSLTAGTPLNNTYKYTGNLYATYNITQGFLKNVSFGGGGNFRGKAKVASTLANAYQYLYAEAYYLLSAHATYRYRFNNKLNARFQLNISNVLDSDKQIFNNYGTYRVSNLGTNPQLQVPNTIRMPEPRKFTVQATFDF